MRLKDDNDVQRIVDILEKELSRVNTAMGNTFPSPLEGERAFLVGYLNKLKQYQSIKAAQGNSGSITVLPGSFNHQWGPPQPSNLKLPINYGQRLKCMRAYFKKNVLLRLIYRNKVYAGGKYLLTDEEKAKFRQIEDILESIYDRENWNRNTLTILKDYDRS